MQAYYKEHTVHIAMKCDSGHDIPPDSVFEWKYLYDVFDVLGTDLDKTKFLSKASDLIDKPEQIVNNEHIAILLNNSTYVKGVRFLWARASPSPAVYNGGVIYAGSTPIIVEDANNEVSMLNYRFRNVIGMIDVPVKCSFLDLKNVFPVSYNYMFDFQIKVLTTS